jgi:hypothetical protein
MHEDQIHVADDQMLVTITLHTQSKEAIYVTHDNTRA